MIEKEKRGNKNMNKEKLNDIVCEASSDYDILNDAYNYIEELEQQVKKQKEVIDKIIEIINYYGIDKEHNDNSTLRYILKDMLDILKEVSE